MYKNRLGNSSDIMATVKNGAMQDTVASFAATERLILKGGRVIDPKNGVDTVQDIAVCAGVIQQVANEIKPEKGDRVINCEDLLVMPGLIDMHVHLGDLFEVTTNPIFGAAQDGVTLGISPGAGNTYMAPSLLGAEVDHGVPINLGILLGGANVLGTCMDVDDLVKMFKGEMDPGELSVKMTRNGISNTTAPLVIGIKEHMGHFLMPDESIDKLYEVTSRADLLFMSHTQDPEHAARVVSLSKGRAVHLGHATAAGCGTHGDPAESMQTVIDLINGDNVTGEFVTSMLRPGRGNRDALLLPEAAQKLAYDAMAAGKVEIMISDGQSQATMKGFGDTRDNVPAILELTELGILPLSKAVATMTCNPVKVIGKRTNNSWWTEKLGHLGAGALANITVVDEKDKLATYTIVNGEIVSFENRCVRRGTAAGGWITKWGMLRKTGVGDMAMFSYQK